MKGRNGLPKIDSCRRVYLRWRLLNVIVNAEDPLKAVGRSATLSGSVNDDSPSDEVAEGGSSIVYGATQSGNITDERPSSDGWSLSEKDETMDERTLLLSLSLTTSIAPDTSSSVHASKASLWVTPTICRILLAMSLRSHWGTTARLSRLGIRSFGMLNI